MPRGPPSRAWHVTGPSRTRAESVGDGKRGAFPRYGRTHGPRTPLPRRRRRLPRRDAWEQSRPDRAGRQRPHHLPPHPQQGREAIRVAHSHPLSDGQPLPPGRRNAGTQPLRGHARPQRSLRSRFQRAPRAPLPRLRPTLLVEGDRIGGAIHGDNRICPQQSPAPRLRPPAG